MRGKKFQTKTSHEEQADEGKRRNVKEEHKVLSVGWPHCVLTLFFFLSRSATRPAGLIVQRMHVVLSSRVITLSIGSYRQVLSIVW